MSSRKINPQKENMAFCSARSVRKTEKNSSRALKIWYNDFDIDYKTLLDKSGNYTIEVRRFRIPGLEIFFKSPYELKPVLVKEYFIRINGSQ